MSTIPLRSPDPQRSQEDGSQAGPYRLVWACLPVALVLSGVVLLLFGAFWWTALVVVLALACPAAMAVAIYFGFHPAPRSKDVKD
jgi:hypothetical protein